jgi:hypothetical protein
MTMTAGHASIFAAVSWTAASFGGRSVNPASPLLRKLIGAAFLLMDRVGPK